MENLCDLMTEFVTIEYPERREGERSGLDSTVYCGESAKEELLNSAWGHWEEQ